VELSSALASSAESATAALARHYEELRAASNGDARRSTEELRAAIDDITTEVSGRLGRALDGFREAAGELRGMASTIHDELDRTREELQRGVAGLPQETEQTTAEMRRVVAEQIKALGELTALVSRSNRSADVIPAGRSRGGAEPAPAAEFRPVAAPTPRPRGAAESRLAEVIRSAKSAPSQEPTPEPIRPEPAVLEAAPSEPVLPEPGTAPEPAPEPRRSVGSLETISGELAHMIDGAHALSLWDRHRRGEPGVFSPELYEAGGHRELFEDIRAKYLAEPGFRRTVDRYVEEFERLLESLPGYANGDEMRKAYLSSETGRVFLILAHTSGRLD
jgi:hypothetical protein